MAESRIIPGEDGNVYWLRESFREARLDDFTDPPAQDPDTFAILNNVMVGVEPSIQRRWGYTLWANPSVIAQRVFETHFSNGRNRFVLTASDGTGADSPTNRVTAHNENGSEVTNPNAIFTPSADAHHPHATTSRNYVYFTDGVNDDLYKWDTDDDPTGSTTSTETGANIPSVTKWGIDTPVPAGANGAIDATATAEGTGDIYLSGGRAYTVAYRNSVSGHVSDIAPFTGRMGITSDPADPTTGVTVELTNIPVSADPQVDQVLLLATSDGGALDTLYEVALLDNGTTTYTDTFDEGVLTAQRLWAEIDEDGNEIGIINNTPPSDILIDQAGETTVQTTVAWMHRGRCYILQGHFLFWSKSQDEVTTSDGNVTSKWEESFPARNQTSISSNGSETGTALLGDEINLYIGTNRSVYSTSGDNVGLIPPRCLYHEVGVLNQPCWQLVYHEGKASGSIWVTPDKRVIASDFITYREIGNDIIRGSSIQTFLNSLTESTIATTARASFVSNGPHEFYMLAVGHASSVVMVFNVRTGAWMKWFTSAAGDTPTALSFMYDSVNRRSLGIFATVNQQIYRWNPATVYDRSDTDPVLPLPTIQTNWFGDSVLTHLLNSIEVQTAESDATISIEGARTMADFTTPTTIDTVTLGTDAFGHLRARLAHLPTKYKWYRLSFQGFDESTETDLLRYIKLDAVPLSNL